MARTQSREDLYKRFMKSKSVLPSMLTNGALSAHWCRVLDGNRRERRQSFLTSQKAIGKLQYTVFRARRITFFLANRVENQNEPKRPQGGDCLGSFWFSTRPTAMGGTDYNALGLWDNLRSYSSICPILGQLLIIQVHYNQCLPLP